MQVLSHGAAHDPPRRCADIYVNRCICVDLSCPNPLIMQDCFDDKRRKLTLFVYVCLYMYAFAHVYSCVVYSSLAVLRSRFHVELVAIQLTQVVRPGSVLDAVRQCGHSFVHELLFV